MLQSQNVLICISTFLLCDIRSTRPDDVAKVEWVQKRSAQVATVCSLITGSLGLLTTIVLGHFSDWKGRKPAAIVNYIGSLISSIIFSEVFVHYLYLTPLDVFYSIILTVFPQ
ncbi:unnamed protein product [Schistocephalus solidus]|uniref:MFS domain-containing protein n=1 Tax=Schistocephalus solidus TaxID=70667 RepID=A0A183TMF7_SCHSO|nr:unnamed protein product [Schistocephalus solidus]